MIRTIQYTNTHPLNKSLTKEAHAFIKSPRFTQLKTAQYLSINKSYRPVHSSIKYQFSKSVDLLRKNKVNAQSYSFTRRQRFKEHKEKLRYDRNTPSPHQYKSPDFVELAVKKNKGISFTQAIRESCFKDSQIKPGPGQYSSRYLNPQCSKTFTIPREYSPLKMAHWNKLGPGQYNTSKQDKPSLNVIFPHSTRFNSIQIAPSPAPGQYQQEFKYGRINNLIRQCPKYTFGKSKRPDFIDNCKSHSPGPGAYQSSFSQFSERSKRIFDILKRL